MILQAPSEPTARCFRRAAVSLNCCLCRCPSRYTDSDLKHGVKQRMTKNQWQMQLLDTIEAEEQVYMAARNELQCLDAWVRGDVVVKLQRMRRQSRRNGRQLELWHNAIAAMKGHKQNVQTNRITAWYAIARALLNGMSGCVSAH